MDPFDQHAYGSTSGFQLGVASVKKELDSLDSAVRNRIIEIALVQNSIKESKASACTLEASIGNEQEQVAAMQDEVKAITWLVEDKKRRRKAIDNSCTEIKVKIQRLRSEMRTESRHFISLSSQAAHEMSQSEEERMKQVSDDRYHDLSSLLLSKMTRVREMRAAAREVEVVSQKKKEDRMKTLADLKNELISVLDQIQIVKMKPPQAPPPPPPPPPPRLPFLHVPLIPSASSAPAVVCKDYAVEELSDDDISDEQYQQIFNSLPLHSNNNNNNNKMPTVQNQDQSEQQHGQDDQVTGGGGMGVGSLAIYQPPSFPPSFPPHLIAHRNDNVQQPHHIYSQAPVIIHRMVRAGEGGGSGMSGGGGGGGGGEDEGLVLTRHHQMTLREITRPINQPQKDSNHQPQNYNNQSYSLYPPCDSRQGAKSVSAYASGQEEGNRGYGGEGRERVRFVIHETMTQIQTMPKRSNQPPQPQPQPQPQPKPQRQAQPQAQVQPYQQPPRSPGIGEGSSVYDQVQYNQGRYNQGQYGQGQYGQGQYPVVDWKQQPDAAPPPPQAAAEPKVGDRRYGNQYSMYQPPQAPQAQYQSYQGQAAKTRMPASHPPAPPPRSFNQTVQVQPSAHLLNPSPADNNPQIKAKGTKRKGAYEPFHSDEDDDDDEILGRHGGPKLVKKGDEEISATAAAGKGKKKAAAVKAPKNTNAAKGRGARQAKAHAPTPSADFFGGGGMGGDWQPF